MIRETHTNSKQLLNSKNYTAAKVFGVRAGVREGMGARSLDRTPRSGKGEDMMIYIR